MPSKIDRDISSAGMDKKIEKNSWPAKRIAMLVGGFVLVALFLYAFIFMDFRSSLNVEKDKLTISTVKKGAFQDFTLVTGTVQPIQTIYLDAVEGGVVEEIFKQSGTMVNKGERILTLSNSDLRLSVLRQTSSIYDQINQTRNSRLNIEQNSLSLKERLAAAENQLEITRSNFEKQQKLYQKDLISEQSYIEAKENYEYQRKRYDLIYESFRQDSIKSAEQLQQIDRSLDRMWRSLDAVQQILDKLVVKAPISGQLSTIELNPGQSIQPGERIGQVDILDSFKVRVEIDEYYLSRIRTGLNGTFDFNNQTYTMDITKVYPVVENGQFEVDMEFNNESPPALTRGQTLRIRLELSEQSTESVLLPRGGFYQATGGNWVFKVMPDGSRAVRQPIDIGRSNPDYFEVLSGLQPGDKVITSSYERFGDNEVLNLE